MNSKETSVAGGETAKRGRIEEGFKEVRSMGGGTDLTGSCKPL